MSDFRLKVFYTVAKRLSFTKAAAELFISQPAVTRHIHELEEQYNNKLFERNGNSICLTPSGKVLLRHTEELEELYRKMDFEMNVLAQRHSGLLHLGASTTISQYVIPPVLAELRLKYPDINVNLVNGNTEQIEKLLLNKDIEVGIIEGRSKKNEINYTEFMNDEIVLVCSKSHPLARKAYIEPGDLKELSLVFREKGSGTLEVIEHSLKQAGIMLTDLHTEISLGNTESIKSYLLHSSCAAFMSVHAVSKEVHNGDLRVIDVKGISIERKFYVIHLQGKTDGVGEIFFRFLGHYYNIS